MIQDLSYHLYGTSWWYIWWGSRVWHGGVEDHTTLLGCVAVKLLVKDQFLSGQVREIEPEMLISILLPENVLDNFVLPNHLNKIKIV